MEETEDKALLVLEPEVAFDAAGVYYPGEGPFVVRLSREEYTEAEAAARFEELEEWGWCFHGPVWWDVRFWCRMTLDPVPARAEQETRERLLREWEEQNGSG